MKEVAIRSRVDPEDEADKLLRDVCWHSTDYTALEVPAENHVVLLIQADMPNVCVTSASYDLNHFRIKRFCLEIK
jgi:hypothetical protein